MVLNMNSLYTKFLCAFVGWDYKLLNECSPASKKTLHRYTGAIMLLMSLWFYIGYSMADRYFKIESSGYQIVVGVVFALIIWIIERQIILIVGKNKVIGGFRIALAVIMAFLGATIIDQVMFGKDIDAQTKKVIAERASDIFETKKRVGAERLVQLQKELDSLEYQSSLLLNDITKRPKITTWKQKITGADSLGNAKYGYEQETEPNPKILDRERVVRRMEDIQKNMASIYDAQQGMWEESEKEATENIGLLTELDITFSNDVIGASIWTIVFYCLVFGFFLLIELLVVSGKMFSNKCDYEFLVEQQQAIKIEQIESILPISTDKN